MRGRQGEPLAADTYTAPAVRSPLAAALAAAGVQAPPAPSAPEPPPPPAPPAPRRARAEDLFGALPEWLHAPCVPDERYQEDDGRWLCPHGDGGLERCGYFDPATPALGCDLRQQEARDAAARVAAGQWVLERIEELAARWLGIPVAEIHRLEAVVRVEERQGSSPALVGDLGARDGWTTREPLFYVAVVGPDGRRRQTRPGHCYGWRDVLVPWEVLAREAPSAPRHGFLPDEATWDGAVLFERLPPE